MPADDVAKLCRRDIGTDVVGEIGGVGGEGRLEIGLVDVLDRWRARRDGGAGLRAREQARLVVASGCPDVDAGRVTVGLEGGIEDVVGPDDVHTYPEVRQLQVGS